MIGRPNSVSMDCPKCTETGKYPKVYGTFRAVYIRRNNRYLRIGRKCIDIPLEWQEHHERHRYDAKDKEGCGHFEKEGA